jgi:hypothetical protein
MAILRMSTVFAQSANELPMEEKVKLPRIFMLLTDNPGHPSLQLQKIECARCSNVYECRLDKSWRIILERTGEMTFDLIYVGTSDEAARFSESLREDESGYGSDAAAVAQMQSYLAGCDDALHFVAVTRANLERWGADLC